MSSRTVALITGANQGIGFATARLLATKHKDYAVIMTGRRADAIEEAAKTLQAEGLGVEPLVLDVTSDASVAAAVAAVEARHGRLDVLINNAAIARHEDPTSADGADKVAQAAQARASWLEILNTNVASVAAVTDAFLPLMKKSAANNQPKRIVFVSSTLGSMGSKADVGSMVHRNIAPVYTSSKAALNMLALHYMVDFEDDKANWKINCTCPGHCATNLNGYRGGNLPDTGAQNSVRLATLGPDGETGTFTNASGSIPW